MDRPDAVRGIEILCYPGFDPLDAIGPYELFAKAADRGADLDARLVTREPSRRVVADHDLALEPQGGLSAAPDLLLVPGGGWGNREQRGAWGEVERGELPGAVADCHAGGSTVASVCTGAMLLAAAGLLDGRPATTHPDARNDLADGPAENVDVRDARVVDDGDVLTAGGVTAGLDLALHVLEEIAGGECADAVAAAVDYERRGTVVDGGASGD